MIQLFRVAVVLMLLICCQANAESTRPVNERHRQLASDIDQILRRTRTPGAAIALFEADGSVWRYTSGFKNIVRKEEVQPQTVFRIGSVSKVFVSLAIMKLVAAGELSLQDRVADVAPEVVFHNPWEEHYPLRVIHLLNHTTGWDGPHSPELVGQGGEPLDIAAVLALHPHSRHSRWVPGTRTAYNNTGPLVAAYIVEKITGTRFEEYVQTTLFDPLSMTGAGYYFNDHYRSHAADLYRGDQALSYWHLPNRAAGGMHASLEDMVRFVRFMQNPDKTPAGAILTSSFVRAMEQPTGTYASEAGLEIGWGTGLTSFQNNGLVLYGHEGALPGARTLVAYEPEGALGHVVMTNGNSPAASQIHQRLAEFNAGTQPSDNRAATLDTGKPDPTLAGFYRAISPANERLRIVASLLPWKISLAEQSIVLSPLFGGRPRALSVSAKGQYLQPETGRIALVKTDDPLVGGVIHYGPMTLQKTGSIAALAPVLLLALWLSAIFLGLIHLLIWGARKLLRRGLSQADGCLRGWSILPLVGLLIAVIGVVMILRSSEPYAVAATVTSPSLMVFAGPIIFLLASLWSLRIWYTLRADAKAGFWYGHATALIFLNVGLGLYLLGYGLIGARLWA